MKEMKLQHKMSDKYGYKNDFLMWIFLNKLMITAVFVFSLTEYYTFLIFVPTLPCVLMQINVFHLAEFVFIICCGFNFVFYLMESVIFGQM